MTFMDTHTTTPLIVDTHAHVYPARALDFLESIGTDPATTRIARNLRASDEPEEMAARLEMMDAAGVDVQVLSATPQVPLVADPEQGAAAARRLNDIYAEILADYPSRFLAYGAIAFNHPDKALEEIERLDSLGPGFVGVAINTLLPDPALAIADPRFEPIFEELDRRGSILYIHPTGSGAHSAPMTEHNLVWVNGAPVEDAIATLHLLKADIPNRYPNLRIHIAHLGGDLPFLARRIEDNYEDWNAFPASPAATLRKMWFDAANFGTGSLRLAADIYDPRKLLVGSDYPYFQDAKYTRAVQHIRDTGLGEATTAGILGGNAAELYGEALSDLTAARRDGN